MLERKKVYGWGWVKNNSAAGGRRELTIRDFIKVMKYNSLEEKTMAEIYSNTAVEPTLVAVDLVEVTDREIDFLEIMTWYFNKYCKHLVSIQRTGDPEQPYLISLQEKPLDPMDTEYFKAILTYDLEEVDVIQEKVEEFLNQTEYIINDFQRISPFKVPAYFFKVTNNIQTFEHRLVPFQSEKIPVGFLVLIPEYLYDTLHYHFKDVLMEKANISNTLTVTMLPCTRASFYLVRELYRIIFELARKFINYGMSQVNQCGEEITAWMFLKVMGK